MRRTFLVVLVVASFSGCVELEQESPLMPRALEYLGAVQNEDGGFSPSGNGTSEFATSAWAALAFGSAAPDHRAIPALRAYLANQSPAVNSNQTGGLSRINPVSLYVLSSLAIEVPDREQHVARLVSLVDNTSLAANEQVFVLGALGRAGELEAAAPLAQRIWAKLLDPQDPDLSDEAWMRAHAILSMVANNVSTNDRDMRAAARSLLEFQKDDKGFRGSMEYEPDASTTAAVVAVLAQVRFVYSSEHLAGLEFLLGLQQPSGSVRFSDEFDFSPVKTSAEAILAATGDGPFRD